MLEVNVIISNLFDLGDGRVTHYVPLASIRQVGQRMHHVGIQHYKIGIRVDCPVASDHLGRRALMWDVVRAVVPIEEVDSTHLVHLN
jgi:hypothetical protein